MWIEALKMLKKCMEKLERLNLEMDMSLNMTEDRLEEIGIKGMVAPFAISCANHEGAGKFAVMQWDGDKFVQVTGWEAPLDPAFIRKLVEDSAAKFKRKQYYTKILLQINLTLVGSE